MKHFTFSLVLLNQDSYKAIFPLNNLLKCILIFMEEDGDNKV